MGIAPPLEETILRAGGTLRGQRFENIRFRTLKVVNPQSPVLIAETSFVRCSSEYGHPRFKGDVRLEDVEFDCVSADPYLLIETSVSCDNVRFFGGRSERLRARRGTSTGKGDRSLASWTIDVSGHLGEVDLIGVDPSGVRLREDQVVIDDAFCRAVDSLSERLGPKSAWKLLVWKMRMTRESVWIISMPTQGESVSVELGWIRSVC